MEMKEPSLLPPYLLLSMMLYGMDQPFGQFRLAMAPSQLFAYRPGRGRAEEEAALMLCKHCLARAKMQLCYQPKV